MYLQKVIDFQVEKEIPVTKPFMPPILEYMEYLKGAWEREYITNNGPLVQKLEKELKNYLGVPWLKYVSNGTIALQLAIKALDLKGEIITTPFSYVATTSSIVWENCTPVFADINPETLNIDPNSIEEVITDKTSGIIATHVFGNPCDVEAIKGIAQKYDLKVIYDAAHCFGTRYKEESIFNFGDISTTSFHATKLFHTVEGGAIVTKDPELDYKVSQMRNFGHAGPGNFDMVGINGKNSEFHAAMGLCNLHYVDEVLKTRKKQGRIYSYLIDNIAGIKTQSIKKNTDYNFAYFPVIFASEKKVIQVQEALEKINVAPRRYFHPSLNKLKYVEKENAPIAESISKRILCLPMYHTLDAFEQEYIANQVINSLAE